MTNQNNLVYDPKLAQCPNQTFRYHLVGIHKHSDNFVV